MSVAFFRRLKWEPVSFVFRSFASKASCYAPRRRSGARPAFFGSAVPTDSPDSSQSDPSQTVSERASQRSRPAPSFQHLDSETSFEPSLQRSAAPEHRPSLDESLDGAGPRSSGSTSLSPAPRKPDFQTRLRAWAHYLKSEVSAALRDHEGLDLTHEARSNDTTPVPPRDQAWENEVRRLFAQRVRVVCLITVVSVPIFALIFVLIAPTAMMPVLRWHSALVLASALIFLVSRRATTVHDMRSLALTCYLVFAAIATVVMVEVGGTAMVVLSGHTQIIISLLFLPFSTREALLCGALVTLSFGIGLLLALPDGMASGAFLPAIASVAFTTAIVVGMSSLLGIMRRRAFDAAFDVVALARENARVSERDALTGGYNRRRFDAALSAEVERATRYNTPLSVLLFDLDGFKAVNDAFGHARGDEVLRVVHDAACDAVRGVDTFARIGGDEFAALLPGIGGEDVQIVAARVRGAVLWNLKHHFGADSIEGRVTLSMGLVAAPPDELISPERLLALADERLYTAKRNGKNQIIGF